MKKSEVIRTVLQQNPEATFSQVKDQLEPHRISEGLFNVVKSQDKKKAQGQTEPKTNKAKKVQKDKEVTVPAVSIDEAIRFVTQGGGLAAVKAEIERRQQLVAAFEEIAKQVTNAA